MPSFQVSVGHWRVRWVVVDDIDVENGTRSWSRGGWEPGKVRFVSWAEHAAEHCWAWKVEVWAW